MLAWLVPMQTFENDDMPYWLSLFDNGTKMVTYSCHKNEPPGHHRCLPFRVLAYENWSYVADSAGSRHRTCSIALWVNCTPLSPPLHLAVYRPAPEAVTWVISNFLLPAARLVLAVLLKQTVHQCDIFR